MNGAKAPETPSPILQEKTVTPETLPTVIGADEGYTGLSQVTVNPDTNLKAENIRSGKTIFGVNGTFEGASTSSNLLNAIFANMRRDGSYAETLDTSTFPEDVGQPNISDYQLVRMLSLGVSVKTLYVNVSNPGVIVVNGGVIQDGPNSKYLIPTKVIVTETTSSYKTGSELGGTILGFPEIPSGGSDRFLAEKVTANIVVDGDMVIDDTHWFANSPYCGYYYVHFRYLGSDGMVDFSIHNTTLVHFRRNVSTLYDYTLSFQSDYSVRFYTETPPNLQSTSVFYNNSLKQIIVPKGSLEAYQTAKYWSNYASKIVEATE